MSTKKAQPTPIPNPGSFDARTRGCVCDRIVNQHGQGCGDTVGGRYFVVDDACPLHHHGWQRTIPLDIAPEPMRAPLVSSCGRCGQTRIGPRASGRLATCCSSSKPRWDASGAKGREAKAGRAA